MIIVNSQKCPQNHPCPAIPYCPVNAIRQKGYGLPEVDADACITCGKCIRVCPMGAFEKK